MIFEPDDSPTPQAPDAAALVVATPEQEAAALVDQSTLAIFTSQRDAFVKHYSGLVVNDESSLAEAGNVIDTCIATKKGVEGVFKSVTDYFFSMHRALTGKRGELVKPLEELAEAMKNQTVSFKLAKAAADKAAAEKAEREARAAAEAKAAAERAAARLAAEQAAAEAEAAAQAAAAAAADEDLDAAMEADAAAEAAAQAAQQAQAQAAEVEAAPVYVPPVSVPVSTISRSAGGGTLVDKWVPEYDEDEAAAVKAIVAEIPTRPELIGLLSVNEDALKKMATALKGEARIPGVSVKNKPIDRRSGARGRA